MVKSFWIFIDSCEKSEGRGSGQSLKKFAMIAAEIEQTSDRVLFDDSGYFTVSEFVERKAIFCVDNAVGR